MDKMGKLFIVTGLILLAVGVVILFLERLGLFRLPGDLVVTGKNWKIYFPLATSLLLSALLTAVLWLIHWFKR